ncbi:MAG: TIM-barrel domain-containing protein, partial [Bryobacteraceae bacterium]
KWVGQFAGDHPSNFDGVKAVLTGALNLCACGFSNWGSDLGGYFGAPEPAVYIRWMQLGLFSPLMRWHGKAPREPWHYGKKAVEIYKFCAWVRENLLNYIYNSAIAAHESGRPIIRSMAIAFPDERSLAAIRDQYMFGEDLLVAPVINELNFRTISFPSGVWTSLWNGKTVSGPATVKVQVPLDTIPVYLRQGSAMPVELNQALQFGKSMSNSRTHALIVTPPLQNQKVSHRDVAVESTAQGFRCTLENLPETSYLLVYGTIRASAVRVDGNILPKRSESQLDLTLPGWRSDQAGSRLIIRLPPIRKQVEVDTIV